MEENCMFVMKLKGTEESIGKFEIILKNEGDSKFRGILNINPEKLVIDEHNASKIISGVSQWDLLTCLFGDESVFVTNILDLGETITDILKESEKLSLEIEIFSYELTLNFEEYFHIKNGRILDESISKLHIESPGIYSEFKQTGGFGDWSFSI